MLKSGVITDDHVKNSKALIEFFKNADPEVLIPLKVCWYYLDFKTDNLVINKIGLIPVKETIQLYMTTDQDNTTSLAQGNATLQAQNNATSPDKSPLN